MASLHLTLSSWGIKFFMKLHVDQSSKVSHHGKRWWRNWRSYRLSGIFWVFLAEISLLGYSDQDGLRNMKNWRENGFQDLYFCMQFWFMKFWGRDCYELVKQVLEKILSWIKVLYFIRILLWNLEKELIRLHPKISHQ